MGARPAQDQLIVLDAIDQEPIGLDVAIAPALPAAFEGMVAVSWGERFTRAEISMTSHILERSMPRFRSRFTSLVYGLVVAGVSGGSGTVICPDL